jgi:VanZ family protein
MENRYLSLYRWRKEILAVFILMWVGAFTATHIPNNMIPKEVHDLGKVTLHGVGFLGLASWFILTLAAFRINPIRRMLLALFVMMVYAAIDEYTQQFFGRSPALYDWTIDTIGTVVAIMLWESIFWLIEKKVKTKTSQN